MASEKPAEPAKRHIGWGKLFGKPSDQVPDADGPDGPPRWSFGVLNDTKTVQVPGKSYQTSSSHILLSPTNNRAGSVLLLAAHRNAPLGLRNVHARTSHSSIPAGFQVDVPMTPGGTRPMPRTPQSAQSVPPAAETDKKTTDDGTIILEPQPDDSGNDPLNWPGWRRDIALISLGFYCMIGGGITTLIAAGFTDVAETYHINVERMSLTTGLYMMGLGVGSVLFSPTAILFGKRPVYLAGAILFIVTCVWAGYSPSFNSLLAARVFQGIAISPVECLPSATIAEIFFLHERAYRIGIYTLLLLGGKNLVPLVSAAIIGSFGWRWVFFIVAMITGLGFVLLFLFVPETFWDRTPHRKPSKRPSFLRRLSSRHATSQKSSSHHLDGGVGTGEMSATPRRVHQEHHVTWGGEKSQPAKDEVGKDITETSSEAPETPKPTLGPPQGHHSRIGFTEPGENSAEKQTLSAHPSRDIQLSRTSHEQEGVQPDEDTVIAMPTIELPDNVQELTSPQSAGAHISVGGAEDTHSASASVSNVDYFNHGPNLENSSIDSSALSQPPKVRAYTHNLRQQPPRSFVQQLRPYHGRLNNDKWIKVMIRPFILFAYPAVLWSAVVYACSIGWLIVVSETLAVIYRDPNTYNFTALQTGLVYVSPFVGGILGTGVAGKISDIVVKAIARRNGGLYEPEFRLIMTIPILITTVIGLMGFGWSAQEKDAWIVPTVFFGIVSFGCALGSTTSITFCVDSYRQYAGEALVTLNFSKNVLHGLVFSLFISQWVAAEGTKMVFIWIGIIQLIFLLFSIPMYIYGKRARMWTVRMNLMEKF